MKKFVKKIGLLSMACVLLVVFAFGAIGCSDNNKGYNNEGYNKLHDYVKENNTSPTSDCIQYTKSIKKTQFIFTTQAEKGSSILVSVISRGTSPGEIDFYLEKEGISNDNFLSVEITTDKVGDYYFQGTTLVRSTDQTSFIFINQKESFLSDDNWTDVSASLIPSLDSLLEIILEYRMLELYNFVENDIGIPMELFDGK